MLFQVAPFEHRFNDHHLLRYSLFANSLFPIRHSPFDTRFAVSYFLFPICYLLSVIAICFLLSDAQPCDRRLVLFGIRIREQSLFEDVELPNFQVG